MSDGELAERVQATVLTMLQATNQARVLAIVGGAKWAIGQVDGRSKYTSHRWRWNVHIMLPAENFARLVEDDRQAAEEAVHGFISKIASPHKASLYELSILPALTDEPLNEVQQRIMEWIPDAVREENRRRLSADAPSEDDELVP